MKSVQGYTAVAKLLHWAMAVLIFIELFLAYSFGSVRHGVLEQYAGIVYWLHFNIGYTILILLVLRILWRFFHKPPALPSDISQKEARFVNSGHKILYLLMFVMVTTGMLRYNMYLGDFKYLNFINIPAVVGNNQGYAYIIVATIHNMTGALLVATIAAHVAMAIRHHIIDKNDILLRMLPKHCNKNK